MWVQLDADGRTVVFNPRQYRHIDHGYAATVHKAQGMTVDQVQVLASKHFDAHATYVAMSRHREQVTRISFTFSPSTINKHFF